MMIVVIGELCLVHLTNRQRTMLAAPPGDGCFLCWKHLVRRERKRSNLEARFSCVGDFGRTKKLVYEVLKREKE